MTDFVKGFCFWIGFFAAIGFLIAIGRYYPIFFAILCLVMVAAAMASGGDIWHECKGDKKGGDNGD